MTRMTLGEYTENRYSDYTYRIARNKDTGNYIIFKLPIYNSAAVSKSDPDELIKISISGNRIYDHGISCIPTKDLCIVPLYRVKEILASEFVHDAIEDSEMCNPHITFEWCVNVDGMIMPFRRIDSIAL